MRALTITDTNVLKGIAILLLLCHHCFYTGEPFDDIVINGLPMIARLGTFSKICVAIFVFLSGYGLTAQAMTKGDIGNLFSFYRRRYVKLMVNYWLIWLIFVPMGVFVFHRTFPLVYGDHYVIRAFGDFLGLHQAIFNAAGYNATWWFYSCIIVLYLIYPIIWRFRRLWFIMIPFAVVFEMVIFHVPFFGPSNVGPYLLSFVCGLSYAYVNPQVGSFDLKSNIILIAVLLLTCEYRFHIGATYLWDAAITITGTFIYGIISIPKCLSEVLAFLGKHSFNIFLFHTFILVYYFHDYIYWSGNPLFIYLTLLAVCIPISMFIEWSKQYFHINQLQNKLMGTF